MGVNVKSIAKQHIRTLFSLARKVVHDDPKLAQRYVNIARKVAMASNVRLPSEFRRQVCRNCKSYVLPGVNLRIRIKQKREPHIVLTCSNCSKKMRILLHKRGRDKR